MKITGDEFVDTVLKAAAAFLALLFLIIVVCNGLFKSSEARNLENAARMYEVEAAETRGYLNALKDTGNAPRPTGGAR